MKNRIVRCVSFMLSVMLFLVSCNRNDEQTLYRIQKNGLYGFINIKGEMIIEPQYKYVSGFSKEGVAYVINQVKIEKGKKQFWDGSDYKEKTDSCVVVRYSFINKENQVVNDNNEIKIKKSTIDYWEEYQLYAMVEKYNSGTLLFNDVFLKQIGLKDGLYIYQDEKTEKFGYKDINKKIVIEAKYEQGRRFCNGVAIVRKSFQDVIDNIDRDGPDYFSQLANTCGAINTKGELVVDYEYSYIYDFSQNGTTWAMSLSLQEENIASDWFNIDNSGAVLNSDPVSVPHGWIYPNDKFPIYSLTILDYRFYTFIDLDGNWLTDFNNDKTLSIPLISGENAEMFKDVIRFSEGIGGVYASWGDETGWFFIDSTMCPISNAFDSIMPFSEGMAAVKEFSDELNVGKWGFVKKDPFNNSIVEAIPFKFSACDDFQGGLAYFSNNGYGYSIEGYIDKEGNIVWQTKRKKIPETNMNNQSTHKFEEKRSEKGNDEQLDYKDYTIEQVEETNDKDEQEDEESEFIQNQRWIDLGLPSGTLWKDKNEEGLYDYNAAVKKFGKHLPTKKQLKELQNSCTWNWTGKGFNVRGRNGNSIFLPAAGVRDCVGTVGCAGSDGYYWSSTPYGNEVAWHYNFDSDGVYLFSSNRCRGQSVRLVRH